MHGQSGSDSIVTSSESGEHPTTIAEAKSEIDNDTHSLSDASSNTADEEYDDPENPPRLERQLTELGPPIKVARLKRRGLFGQLALVAEVENPKTYPRKMKWFITFVVALAGATAPMGSAVFLPSLSQVTKDLNTTTTITNLSIALYMLAMSIFPLWWSSFSERLGRRTVYLASFTLFVVFNCLCAISNSIAMLIVMRMLSGGAAASVQAVGAGTIADIWESRERGRAMGIFYLGPLCGPLFAPIIGGLLAQRWGWRSTMWFLSAFGALTLIFILFALPETLMAQKPVLAELEEDEDPAISRPLSRVSSQQVVRSTARWLKTMKIIFIDPLKIILYLRFLPVLLSVYYASIAFGSLYVLNISVEHTFAEAPYNFSTIIVGLLYIPNSLGYMVTSIFGGKWMDNIMQREAKKANRYDEKGRLVLRPEDRMRENAWLGAFMYPAALIWYGWAAEKGVFWLVPMIANFFFGMGSMLIFSMVTTMLTEFMPKRSSEGVALNNFMRNIFSCIGSVVTAPIIDAIGNGWLFTILGLVSLASSSVIFLMRVNGPKWRKIMDVHMQA
ncbi:Major facilitator superfamily domain general substrate transporter [Penicillium cf. griseofulvum]|uniref:Major facilitator superfamily domain general substrate transporter n=1 Tax=Penicillium cf. griseofulvum TaxID=2972120 RepID=A0A9W9MRK7_9EURO|nr:Major facilitator superfamily domain general substrate transporter [Penicillium cf. griseofulvum]KAJ5440805.1 Major facilitator superfamily domain general substrate transporter [Penicillium cf. griseofulvum]KAJ5448851.1 Major facilitator superfamily domain general substrate transporter [Penicillium cf. griseofulvum]